VDWQGLTFQNGDVNGFFFSQYLVVRNKNLARVSLAVNVDEENMFPSTRQTCGK
jgi:hypothetical protein